MIPTVINHGIKMQIPVVEKVKICIPSFVGRLFVGTKRKRSLIYAIEATWTVFVPLKNKDVILDFNLN